MSEDLSPGELPMSSVPPDGYRRAAVALHRFFEATWQEGGESRARIEVVLSGGRWTEEVAREYQSKIALTAAEASSGDSQQEKS